MSKTTVDTLIGNINNVRDQIINSRVAVLKYFNDDSIPLEERWRTLLKLPAWYKVEQYFDGAGIVDLYEDLGFVVGESNGNEYVADIVGRVSGEQAEQLKEWFVTGGITSVELSM